MTGFHVIDRLLEPRPLWFNDAACTGMDPNVFFPLTTSKSDQAAALAVCARCPVTDLCLAYALEHDEPGVWGGMTARQRTLMRRHLGSNRGLYIDRLRTRKAG